MRSTYIIGMILMAYLEELAAIDLKSNPDNESSSDKSDGHCERLDSRATISGLF